MIYAKMTVSKQEKMRGRWVETETFQNDITEEQYENITCKETLAFFKGLGGKEVKQGNKLISTSPGGDMRTVRTFDFNVKK